MALAADVARTHRHELVDQPITRLPTAPTHLNPDGVTVGNNERSSGTTATPAPESARHIRELARLRLVGPRRRRLAVEIAGRWIEVDQRSECSDATVASHLDAVRRHLDLAETYVRRFNRVDEGWAHVFSADEELIQTFDDQEVLLAASKLQREANRAEWIEKMAEWRRDAVCTMVARVLKQDDDADQQVTDGPEIALARLNDDRKTLQSATHLRNQGISSWFWLLGIVRHHQLALLAIGTSALITLLVLLYLWLGHDGPGAQLTIWPAPLMAICAGILGAVVSAGQRSTKVQGTSILLQAGTLSASLSRIPIGAVAGLTTWALALATSAASPVAAANLLLAAFGAGFAERLVVNRADPQPGPHSAPSPLRDGSPNAGAPRPA